jgi:NTE family protein
MSTIEIEKDATRSTRVTSEADGGPERRSGDKPAKQFGLVLQAPAALGAYEAGAVEYLYSQGMECAMVTGASAGAANAAALAGAIQDPPRVLRTLWEKIAVDGPIPFLPKIPVPFLPQWLTRLWFSYIPSLVVPGMYRPRLDVWNLPDWTYIAKPTMGKTLRDLEDEGLVDWAQVRDPAHMRLAVSASGVEDGRVAYFTNIPADKLPQPLEPEYQPVRFGIEHVLASGSFPGGFPWTTIRDRAYWDGGLTDNAPLKPILDNLTEDEAASMPIYMIDVNVAAAPRPANLYWVSQRMLELLVQNRLRSDLETAASYTRFISLLKKADELLPNNPEWKKIREEREAMGYHYFPHIHQIDIKKPGGDSAADFSRQAILRRIGAGYDQTRAALEKMPLVPPDESTELSHPDPVVLKLERHRVVTVRYAAPETQEAPEGSASRSPGQQKEAGDDTHVG